MSADVLVKSVRLHFFSEDCATLGFEKLCVDPRLVLRKIKQMSAAKHSLLPRVAPGILRTSTEFLKGDVLNAEELLKLKPDVVFYRVETAAHARQLALTGIPAVGFSTALSGFDTIRTFESWVKLLGEVL